MPPLSVANPCPPPATTPPGRGAPPPLGLAANVRASAASAATTPAGFNVEYRL
jgi:hypothetical protein